METDKLLYHFNKESDFLANQINLPNTGIAFVKDSQTIYTHEKEYNMVSWGELKIENGVYVYTNKGELIKPEEWDTGRNEEAVGVAVITDNTRMCIGKSGRNSGIAWSNNLYGIDIPGVTNANSSNDDYNGQANTAAIIAAAPEEDSSNNAAHWCYTQTITVNENTVHGYLPAIGELYDAYQNKSIVNNTISKIGGANIFDGWNWTSSEFSGLSTDMACTLNFSNGNLSTNLKKGTYAPAFSCFPID